MLLRTAGRGGDGGGGCDSGAAGAGVRCGGAAQRAWATRDPRRRRAAPRHVPRAQHDDGPGQRLLQLLWGRPWQPPKRVRPRARARGVAADVPRTHAWRR